MSRPSLNLDFRSSSFLPAFDSHAITESSKRKVKGIMKKGAKERQPCGGNATSRPLKSSRILVYLCPPAAPACRPELRRKQNSRKVRSLVQGFPTNSRRFQPIPTLKNIHFLNPPSLRFLCFLLLNQSVFIRVNPWFKPQGIIKLPNEPILDFSISPANKGDSAPPPPHQAGKRTHLTQFGAHFPPTLDRSALTARLALNQ